MSILSERFRAAMEARLKTLPINARHLVVATGIAFEESPLPEQVKAILTRDGESGSFRLTISSALGEKTQNLLYAKALAHMLLNGAAFQDGDAWIEGDAQAMPILYPAAAIGPEEEARASALAIEILVPTIALREQFLYTQGNIAKMADAFWVSPGIVQRACVRNGLLDARAKIA
jgi:hypothetical protein